MPLDQEQFELLPPTPSRHSPFIPIDPYLGRPQSWTVVRQALIATLVGPNTDSPPPVETSTGNQLADYVASSDDSVRPLLVLSDDPKASTRVLAGLAKQWDGRDDVKLSATFVRHKPRLCSLPLLLRKTGLELLSSVADQPPAPSRNNDIAVWFRSVLASLTQRTVIIWDAIDCSNDLETGFPWLWLTSPLPSGVKLVISSKNDPSLHSLINLWQSRGMGTISLPPSNDPPPPTQEDLSQDEPLCSDIAPLLAVSRGGRTVEELAELLPLATEEELDDAIRRLSPKLEKIEHGRLALVTAVDSPIGDSETRKSLADWLATKPHTSDHWLWEYPWQLAQLGQWEAMRQLLTNPLMTWRLWSHHRADLVDYVTKLEKDEPGSWRSNCDQARERSDFQPHHGLAYAGLLTEVHDFESARMLLINVADRATEAGSALHASIARRRAVECAREAGDHATAWADFERMEEESPRSTDFRIRGQWSLLATDLLIDLQKLPEAESRLLVLEKEAHDSGNVWFETESLVRQAALALLRNDQAGLSTIDSRLLANARAHGWNRPHLTSLAREIQRKIDANDWQETETLARQQQEVAARLADLESLSQSLGTLAFLMNRQGKFQEMATLLGAKERLCREVGDMPAAIDLLLSRTVVIGLRMGDVATAIPLAKEARQLAEQKGDGERSAKARQLLERLQIMSQAGSQ